jgi:hypothetical protein
MKKVFLAALLALPFVAVPARAQCGSQCCLCLPCCPFRVEVGGCFNFKVNHGCPSCGTQLGPWYQYFPYEAHFQSAAPIGFPYWPSPQTLPPPPSEAYAPQAYAPQAYPSATPPVAYGQPSGYQSPYFQPVGYAPQAPSYWYERR